MGMAMRKSLKIRVLETMLDGFIVAVSKTVETVIFVRKMRRRYQARRKR